MNYPFGCLGQTSSAIIPLAAMRLLIKEGRVQDAVEKFMLVAQLYSLRGDASAAIRLLSRVTQMAPMDLSIRGRLIELLTAQGRVDEAIQQYIDLAEIYNLSLIHI